MLVGAHLKKFSKFWNEFEIDFFCPKNRQTENTVNSGEDNYVWQLPELTCICRVKKLILKIFTRPVQLATGKIEINVMRVY